jgi:hemoglobin-like flavoprotein
MNVEKTIKEIAEKHLTEKVPQEKINVVQSELLSYIRLSLCEAYKIGYTDGYDCAKIDLGKD